MVIVSASMFRSTPMTWVGSSVDEVVWLPPSEPSSVPLRPRMAWWPRLSSSSNDGQTADLLEVGRIDKVHGLRGEVLVGLVTNMIEARTSVGTRFWAESEWLTVASARVHKNKWLMTFDAVADRNAAEALKGRVLHAPPLPSDAIATGEVDGVASEVVAFVHELIGLGVQDQDGVIHGEVAAVVDNPASDLLELLDGRLIPLSFYRSHDDELVVVEVPPGLLTDSESVSERD